MSTIITKKCNKCGKTKNISEFHLDVRTVDGHTSQCRSCRCKAQRSRNIYNKDKIHSHNKSYYLKNKKQENERSKKYRQEHRDRIIEYLKSWRLNNKNKTREYSIKRWNTKSNSIKQYIKNWRKNNPLKSLEYARNRSALKRKSSGKISSTEWVELCNKYGNQCLCCKRTDVKLTLDHVIPLKLG